MDASSLIAFLLIGAIAGWLAGLIMRGGGFGLLGNIILGVIGAFVGGWLKSQFDLPLGSGLIGSILTSMIGAVVILFIAGLFKR